MMENKKTLWIRVYGIVQGVGFRPFVSRIADAAGLIGSVANKGSYVEIYATGIKEQLHRFINDLQTKAPERSAVLKIDVDAIKEVMEFEKFEIIESEKEEGDIFVSPDIATCPKCKKELFDKKNRRYMHPFINCTACGPRLTILDAMPYDRERTSMKEFPMCKECEYEYTHAETRRYDAQPVCCNECGPQVYLIGKDIKGREAITATRKAIKEGQIVAIKGIGGFHLCCDAKNERAVKRLRMLKHRPMKPFAVMMKDIKTARRECALSDAQEEILDGHQKPIILLKKKKETTLSSMIAPGNPNVGVMLPYAPVQMLLFDYNDEFDIETDCLVMTSGNVSGAPICRTDEDAISQLSDFCDLMLSHNRKIRLRADDSVMDFYKGKPYMIRRSRGYAPLPTMLSHKFKGQVLAVGGELKNTFCIGKNQLFYPSPYVGDMADLRTVHALEESIMRMEELLETIPTIVACDMHPKYNTTLIAEEQNIPVIKVQHHYAHIVSCMAENDYDDKVIGVSFDGTGYGLDGTIWGGEILLADYKDFERKMSIMPFWQIGGDISAKEGWRIAVSMINEIDPENAEMICESLDLCDKNMQKLSMKMAQNHINCVRSTSVGRLFDAVSAILGICKSSTFEGEASMSLQFAAEEYEEQINDKESIKDRSLIDIWQKAKEGEVDHLPTDRLVKYMIDQKLAGEDVKKLAYLFHKILAMQIVDACVKISHETGITTCALSGGVFQNKLLLRLSEEELKQQELKVLTHSLIPPNDGGIALGQAVVAMNQINMEEE